MPPEILGLMLAVLAQFVAFLWWAVRMAWAASRLHSQVEALERWRDDHSVAQADLARQIQALTAEMAKLGQGFHDFKGWLQRVDSRLDLMSRSLHVGPAE